ncbi:hypothetical protein WAI453_000517 [Rhynchosporium graminicola]
MEKVAEAGADVIWSDPEEHIDFPGEPEMRLEAKDFSRRSFWILMFWVEHQQS